MNKELSDALVRIADALEAVREAVSNAQPTTEPEPELEPEPEPAYDPWIVDLLPTESDGDEFGEVAVPSRNQDNGYGYVCWMYIHPGTPWLPKEAKHGPWDPTVLDKNGWIRSRSPTKEDAFGDDGAVYVPQLKGYSFTHYSIIVPGQPWAPRGCNPSPYEP